MRLTEGGIDGTRSGEVGLSRKPGILKQADAVGFHALDCSPNLCRAFRLEKQSGMGQNAVCHKSYIRSDEKKSEREVRVATIWNLILGYERNTKQ